MNKLYLLAIFCCSFHAQANYQIGDFVQYQLEQTFEGKKRSGDRLRIIKDISEDGEKALLSDLTAFSDGDSSGYEDWVWMDAMASKDFVEEMLRDCESLGHRREMISVPAGDFETCRIDFSARNKAGFLEYGSNWIGRVPWGLIRSVYNGSVMLSDTFLLSHSGY